MRILKGGEGVGAGRCFVGGRGGAWRPGGRDYGKRIDKMGSWGAIHFSVFITRAKSCVYRALFSGVWVSFEAG